MKILLLFFAFAPVIVNGQHKVPSTLQSEIKQTYIESADNLTLEGAYILVERATTKAAELGKKVSIAILDASGNIIILVRGSDVGVHNTEAARRKAYTALSTKTPTLALLQNASSNPDTSNLNTLPELLLLSGGVPIWYNARIVGSIGIAGGGSPANDDLIAKAASIKENGITTN